VYILKNTIKMSYKKSKNILENDQDYDKLLYMIVDKLKSITDETNIIYKINYVAENKNRCIYSSTYDPDEKINKNLVFSFLQRRFNHFGLGEYYLKYKNIIQDIPIVFDNFNVKFMKENGYFYYFRNNKFLDLCTDIYYDYVDHGNTTFCNTIGKIMCFINNTVDILYFHIEYQEHSVGENAKIYLSRDLFHLLKYAVNSKHVLALATLYDFDKKFPSIFLTLNGFHVGIPCNFILKLRIVSYEME